MGSDCVLYGRHRASIYAGVCPEDFWVGRSRWRFLGSACNLCIAYWLRFSDSRDSSTNPSNPSNAIGDSNIRRRDFSVRRSNGFADVRSRSLVRCQAAPLATLLVPFLTPPPDVMRPYC
jgi:hypothetical protein